MIFINREIKDKNPVANSDIASEREVLQYVQNLVYGIELLKIVLNNRL